MEGTNDAHIITDPLSSIACPKCKAMLHIEGVPAFNPVQCPSCSFEFPAPVQFGSFLLLQMLGAGGMGGVYRARDEGLNREVAIKVMLKSLGDDPKFVETFQREAQAAAKLNNPHIAQIYAFGQEKGQPYIAMELVSGGSLDKMMATQGPLSPAVVMHIGAQIAEGLREAAEAGLVHGDVKPENILFDNDKNAKLVDFGLAAMNSGSENEVWGTPYYIAPEKVRRQKSDFRSDIYSLGATLYHAIANVPPFDGEDATAVVKARFEAPPKPLRELRADIPEEVDALIARMLEVDPQTRYPTYGSLLGDMRRYLAKAGPVKVSTSSKKIMIKGKHPKNTTGMTSTTGNVSELSPGMVSVGQLQEAQESAEAASRRGCKMAVLILIGLVFLTLLVAGGIFAGIYYTKAKKEKAETAQIEKAQTSARSSIANSVKTAKIFVERLRAYAPEAMEYATAAADAVAAVLGEEARTSLVPPEPQHAPSEAATPATPAPAAATNAPPTAVAPDATLSNATASASNTVAAATGTHAPEPEAAVEEAPAAPAETPVAEEALPPVVQRVRGMYSDAYAVKRAALLADRLLEEVEGQAAKAESLTAPEQAKDLVQLANSLVEKVNGLSYIKELGEVPRSVSLLKKTLESVKSEAASLAESKKNEAKLLEQKRKAQEAEEKQRLEKQAHQQKVTAEREKISGLELSNAELVKQLKFREAIVALRNLRDELETDEAKLTVAIAIDRVNRVKEFHTYLVEKVKGFKSARGWSIDDANNRTLSVGGIKMPWVDVYTKRPEIIGEFINELVRNEQATNKLKLSEKTQLMTNAALCLSLFYPEVASAQELAKQMATAAAQQFDLEADTIKLLLPQFFTE